MLESRQMRRARERRDRKPCNAHLQPRPAIPTIRHGNFGYFDTGGRFWTPAWDYENGQPQNVKEVLMPDGSWHAFESFVSEAAASSFRESIGG